MDTNQVITCIVVVLVLAVNFCGTDSKPASSSADPTQRAKRKEAEEFQQKWLEESRRKGREDWQKRWGKPYPSN